MGEYKVIEAKIISGNKIINAGIPYQNRSKSGISSAQELI